MSNITAAKSRDRFLSELDVEDTTAVVKDIKRQKTNREDAAAAQEYTTNEEIKASLLQDARRIVEPAATSEENLNTVVITSRLGAEIGQEANKGTNEANKDPVAADVVRGDTDQANEESKQSPNQSHPCPSECFVPAHLLNKKYDILARSKSIVPGHLLNKKYDTMLPPWQPRHDCNFSRAAGVVPYDDIHSSHTDLLEPSSDGVRFTPQLRDTSQHQPASVTSVHGIDLNSAQTETNPAQEDPIISRRMVTPSKNASVLQKTITGYSGPGELFPEDFTLTELCMHHPNHLFGGNLHPFLQHEWSPTKIFHLLPAQTGVAEDKKTTVNGITSRLRKAKTALEKLGVYDRLMNGPKPHAEQ